jgi:hypothetical protein
MLRLNISVHALSDTVALNNTYMNYILSECELLTRSIQIENIQ